MSSTNSNRKHTRAHQILKRNKRLRKEVKITPWRDEWELEAVGRALMTALQPNHEPSQGDNWMPIEHAFKMVAVWRARSNALDALPHAVESTAALAQIYWRDNSQRSSLVSAMEFRLAYSCTIVRCINGLADVLQQQRFAAAPISILCGQLGIPSWLVDIRHETSHNALPTLAVLRLAASTLLAYLKNEYWIPSCPNWKTEADQENIEGLESEQKTRAVDYFLKYKACAMSSSLSATGDATGDATTTAMQSDSTKRKQKNFKPIVTTLSVDPLFGECDGFSSSDDDDDWDDPVMGGISLWGSSIGTNTNRYALLEPPKSKSKKKVEKKKPKPQKKKQPGEKYPIDYAKEFIKAVSPYEGLSVALSFLVWGGVGGAPTGRGVLIPGSAVAFPASTQGVIKSWHRYAPLIQVLGRGWPGFCPLLLVHLVDFVLSIEDSSIQQEGVEAGSARKLFFLSSWIRLLLSEHFVTRLDPELISKASKTNWKSTELVLANVTHLEKQQYPLNSLYDRCLGCCDRPALRTTSRDVLHSLEKILGANGMENFGIPNLQLVAMSHDSPMVTEQPETHSSNVPSSPADQLAAANVSPDLTERSGAVNGAVESGSMSLDAMEAMLLGGQVKQDLNIDDNTEKPGMTDVDKVDDDAQQPTGTPAEAAINEEETTGWQISQRNEKRQAWIRCSSWDPCSIGTLPGYPI